MCHVRAKRKKQNEPTLPMFCLSEPYTVQVGLELTLLVQDDIKFLMLLPLPAKCWEDGNVFPHPLVRLLYVKCLVGSGLLIRPNCSGKGQGSNSTLEGHKKLPVLK